MSKPRHSPAPWRRSHSRSPDAVAFEDAAGNGVALVRLLKEDCDADRRLIEAAPELLEVLARLWNHGGGPDCACKADDVCPARDAEALIARVALDPYESLRCLRCDVMLVPGPPMCTDGKRHIVHEPETDTAISTSIEVTRG